MPIAILLLIILAIAIYLPQVWTRHILSKYSTPDPDIPGTGAEFARHLLKLIKIDQVKVEETSAGDHYDPTTRTVRLHSNNHDKKSLTALVTAAHEVGHAIQDIGGYEPFHHRTALVIRAEQLSRISGVAAIAIPVLIPLTRSPLAGLLAFGIGFIAMGVPVITHLSTLPVEYDASFNRALPLLEKGEYLSAKQLRAARRILKACALTYVAGSLASLLNLWRWLKALRH
ncbi:MAG: zinc metallopeptidase [Gammaproteobacteria bacterium]|nr:zinc metallopeptidase [Gammaproteobacteria bacterium]